MVVCGGECVDVWDLNAQCEGFFHIRIFNWGLCVDWAGNILRVECRLKHYGGHWACRNELDDVVFCGQDRCDNSMKLSEMEAKVKEEYNEWLGLTQLEKKI